MNVSDAAHATVHDYPGGSESLAPRMGMSAAVLRNKVNPNNDRNALTLEEASKLITLAKDARILQALGDEHGFAMSMVDTGPLGMSLSDLSLDACAALGALAHTVRMALDDGIISEREMREIEAAGMTSQRTVMLLMRKLHEAAAKRPGQGD